MPALPGTVPDAAPRPLAFAAPRGLRPAVDVGPAVVRVRQHPMHDRVARTPPRDPLAAAAAHRQVQRVLQEPQQRLPRRAQFLELREHQRHRLAHPTVGVLLQPPVLRLDVAGRRRHQQLAAPRLREPRLHGALAKQFQLVLAQRPLDAEQQPVAAGARRVHRLVVDQQRVHDAAHLHQPLPVPRVAREARRLARRDGAHLAHAHLRHHPLEAGPVGRAGRRTAEVLVDHLDLAPAHLAQPTLHRVLQPPALLVARDLVRRRLPNVQHRLARQMARLHLLVHRPPPGADPPRPPASAAPAAPPPAAWLPPAASATPGPSAPGGTDPAAPVPSPTFASPSPFSSWERGASSSIPPVARASSRSDLRADSADQSARGSSATARPAQKARSNIHAGISSAVGNRPSRVRQCSTATPSLVSDACTCTRRPCQGCHAYTTCRRSVMWVFTPSVVQLRKAAFRPRLPHPERVPVAQEAA